jgi:hypothetical protein
VTVGSTGPARGSGQRKEQRASPDGHSRMAGPDWTSRQTHRSVKPSWAERQRTRSVSTFPPDGRSS